MDIDLFSSTVAQIYDASLNPERWDGVLRDLAALFDSQKAQISYFTSFLESDPFIKFFGFDHSRLDPLLPKFLELSLTDPRRPPKAFRAYHCRQLISDDLFHAAPIYQQVLAATRIEYSMYFFANLDGDEKCTVSVMRGPEGAPYTAGDCEDFGRLIPHICRAATIHGALRRARGAAAAAQGLIDGVPLGMMVVQDERVLLANAAARAILTEGDGLRVLGGRLQAPTPPAQMKLASALREARKDPGAPTGVTLPAGETGQLRLIVRRLDASVAGMLVAPPGAIALYLADSRRPVETNEDVLRRLFGLTEREAAVLNARVRGESTRAIAQRLGVGAETVKTHLHHVMEAAGVNRQAELIRLVLSSPAWIRGPDALGGGLPQK